MLLRTKAALDECEAHLSATDSWNSEIESYLTQHVLIVLCADIQQSIYQILESRLDGAGDIELKNFAIATGKRCLRSVGKNEVSGFLGFFSTEAKNYLNTHIADETVSLYSNAINSRHDVAHSVGTKITFMELQKVLEASVEFLCVVKDAIFSSLNRDGALGSARRSEDLPLDLLIPPVPNNV
ncbi:hypothetical protein PspCFBP13508_05950 [Pseudomonas sp. CFBP13508]|uniref:hypothetical protein n=1 Tax=Pseudomonas sp. CFBP13508 TaxID=2184009 RepID=UPI0010C099CC|nr:hypothetical protein [Pseudomonas sp. CFBP13508]TKJ73660.1 hypothetical protein PspCFBP13508_05950 [Pseudomonas sp. CFBP13508]